MLQTAWPAHAGRRVTGSTGGSRTRNRQGLSLAALPVCVPCRQRPVRDSNPSHLLDRQAVTPASSQGVDHPPEHLAGVEPARPPWESGRLPLHHRCVASERPVGVEPTHPPWRGGRQPLHHGRVARPEHPVGVEPTRPSYQDGRLPLHHRCVGRPSSKGGRIRTHTRRFGGGRAAVTPRPCSVRPEGLEPSHPV